MFVFYDILTTGRSPAFDPPLQFAAILMDDDFNQVERVDVQCSLFSKDFHLLFQKRIQLGLT